MVNLLLNYLMTIIIGSREEKIERAIERDQKANQKNEELLDSR